MNARDTLDKVRSIAMALPGAHETLTWGHPQFRVSQKIFCAVETTTDGAAITIKVGKSNLALFLADPRFVQAEYVGRHGWVTLDLNRKVPAAELRSLIATSHHLVSSKLPKRSK